MGKEIERKFLVVGNYKEQAYEVHHVVQGYICADKGRTVRIRIRNDKGYLTIKGPSDNSGLSRCEWEYEIPLSEAKELIGLCESGVIDKNRYLIRCGKHIFEIDEFHGDNEGLVLAEVELVSEDESFDKPVFLGIEVTGDIRYYNSYLVKHPFKFWR